MLQTTEPSVEREDQALSPKTNVRLLELSGETLRIFRIFPAPVVRLRSELHAAFADRRGRRPLQAGARRGSDIAVGARSFNMAHGMAWGWCVGGGFSDFWVYKYACSKESHCCHQ